MSKTVKRTLYAVVAVLALVVVAVIAGPALIDVNRYKPEIAAAVQARTGRALAIDGDIEFAIVPAPRLSVAGLRLANFAGAATPDMLRIERAELRVALWPLLHRVVAIEELRLIKPEIALERGADGRASWDFEAPADATPEASGEGFAVRLDSLVIENASVTYSDAASGRVETIGSLDATIRAADLAAGPFEVAGDMVARGVPLDFTLDLGAITPGEPVTVTFEARSAIGKAPVALAATIAAPAIDATIEAGAQDLGALLAAATGAAVSPVFAQPFGASAKLTGQGDGFAVADLDVTLGDLRITGDASARLGDPLEAVARLDVGTVNLDTLLPMFAGDDDSGPPGVFALPGGIVADLEVTAEALIYNGQTIQDAQIKATLADETVLLRRLFAALPGDAAIEIDGRLAAVDGAPDFRGALRFDAGDPRGLMRWLGVAPPDLPADRLSGLSLTAGLTGGPTAVALDGIEARLDETMMRGGLAGDFGARPALDLDLAIDKLDLDAYRPTAAANDADVPAPADPLAALAPLAGFDATVSLTIGRLTLNRQRVAGVTFAATLVDGTLEVSQARIDDLAGATVSARATITDIASEPAFDISYRLAADDIAGLAALAGTPLPVQAAEIGVLQSHGMITGDATMVTVEATAEVAGATAEIGGTVGLVASAPVDARVVIEAVDPTTLLRLAGLAPPPGLGALAVRLTAKGDATRAEVDAKLALDDGMVTIQGELAALDAAPRFALDVSAGHPSLYRLIRSFAADVELTDGEALGPLKLTGRITGDATAVTLSGLAGTIVRAEIGGDATLRLGDTPAASAVLRLGRIDLDRLMSALRPVGAPAETTEAGGFALPMGIAADLDLGVEEIAYRGQPIREMRLLARLRDGELAIERVSARLPGETIFGLDGRLAAVDGAPRFNGALTFDSNDPRGLLAWLDVPVPELPADRLRALSLAARVRATPRMIALDGLEARLDATTLTGGLSATLGARQVFAADLALDTLDLDAYRPPAGDAPPTDQLAALAPLAGFDAELSLAVGRLTLGGETIDGIRLDLALTDGDLALDGARIDDVAGVSIDLAGRVNDLGDIPSFELDYAITAAALERFGVPAEFGGLAATGVAKGTLDLIDIDANIALDDATVTLAGTVADLAGAAHFDVAYEAAIADTPDLGTLAGLASKGRLAGDAERIDVDAAATMAGADFAVVGTVGLAANAPIDATLRIDAADPARLLGLAGLSAPAGLGALAVRLDANGTTVRAAIDAEIALADARLDLVGTLTDLAGSPGYDLRFIFDHPSLYRLIQAVAADVALADGEALGPIALQGRLAGDARRVQLTDLAGTVATADIAGEADVSLGPAASAGVALRVETLDLDLLLPALASAETGADAPATVISVPAGIDLDLAVAIDRVVYRDQAVRETRLQLSLGDGVLSLRRLSARLPGATAFELAGATAGGGVADFQGSLALESDDPAALLAWFGASVTGATADRLQRLGVSAALRAAPDAAALDALEVRFDETTLSGSLSVALGARPAFTVDLALDRLDLDAYRFEPPAGDATGDPFDSLAAFDGFDATLALTVGHLTRNAQAIEGIRLAARLENGTLTIDEAKIDNLAGAVAELQATISDLATTPRFALDYRVATDDIAGLAALVDPNGAEAAAGLGGLEATGHAKGSSDAAEVAVRLVLRDATITLDGTATDLGGSPRFDVAYDVAIADTTALFALAGVPPPMPPAEIGAIASSGRFAGDVGRASLDADIRMSGGRLRLAGNVADLTGAPRYGIGFTAEHPDLSKLIRLAAADYRPAGGDNLGALALRGKLQGGPEAIVLSDLAATIGALDLAGDAELSLDGPVPRLIATLTSQRADLRALMPAETRGQQTDSKKVFSREPLPFEALQQIDADLRIRAAKVFLPRFALRDVALDVNLSGGHLTVLPLHARIGGGVLDGGIDLRPLSASAAALSVTVSVARLYLGMLLKDLQVTDTLEGKLDVAIDVSGRGGSVAELMAGLDGRTSVVMGEGRIDSKYVDLAGADLGSAVNLILDPFSGRAQYTEINCFVSRFDIARGLATANGLVLDTRNMIVVGEGTVNLASERLDLSLKPSAKQNAANIGFSLGELAKALRVGGTLANPRVAIDPTGSVVALSKALGGVVLFGPAGIAAALLSPADDGGNACVAALEAAESGVPVAGAKQQQQEPQGAVEKTKKKIDDAVEELGGKLLKGLFGN